MHTPIGVSLTPRFAVRGLCVLILLVFSTPLCVAATLYVSPLGSDDNSGAIGAPYKTIQAAVNNASSGDTIALAYAIYQGNGNRDIDFAGKSLSVVSQSGPGKAIIDCQGTPQAPHYAFNFHSKETNIIFEGLTIKNASGGGAVRVEQECSIKINHCAFRDNTEGCVTNNGTATLSACLFLSNLYNSCITNVGTVTLTGCTFNNNKSAGLYNGALATLTNCKFTANTVYAAVVENGGTATLTGCTFTGNTGATAGGVANSGTATLTGCTLTGNTGTNSNAAAGGVRNGGTTMLTGCTITGNTGTYGGGVGNVGTATLTNCIIFGNTTTAGNGGGISNRGIATIRFCSILGNVAKTAPNQQTPAQGGGLENDGTATLTNDVFWGNTAPYASEIGTPVNGNQKTTATYCDIQGGLSGTGNIKVNPGFMNAANGNLHLQASSPCRGTGITMPPLKADPNQYDSKPDPGVSTDADGRQRPNPPSIGAYEYTANPPPAKKQPLLDLDNATTKGATDNAVNVADAAAVPTTSITTVPPAPAQVRTVLGPAEQKQANDEFLHLMVSIDTNTLSHDEMTRQIQGELAKGAQIDARDGEGFPVIVTAASLKRTDIVQVLLEIGADPNALTVQVGTAGANDASSILHKTANGYQVDFGAAISSIFGRKSKPKPAYGQSALMFAAQNGVTDMVMLLLNAKAVVNMRDNRGKSSLDYANDAHHNDIVATLKAHGAD